jgi:acetylglutamate/LysW-gamma-L-alpha-aminoadipate kinase
VPIIDENGFAINSENDDIVALLNEVLKPDKIIQFIEAPGLLKDAEDEQSVVPELSKSELTLWEERLSGRIKRKIHALNKLFVNNNPELIIVDGRVENPIYNVLNKIGTIVK